MEKIKPWIETKDLRGLYYFLAFHHNQCTFQELQEIRTEMVQKGLVPPEFYKQIWESNLPKLLDCLLILRDLQWSWKDHT